MNEAITWILVLFAFGGFLFAALFIGFSIAENERKAALKMVPVLSVFIFLEVAVYFSILSVLFQTILIISVFILIFIVVLPFGNKPIKFPVPEKRFDERDVMFSRAELKANTEKFNRYYSMRPDHLQPDNAFREAPGLLHSKSKYYNPFIFNAANASFTTVNLLQPLVEGTPGTIENKDFNAAAISSFIKNWTIKLGAHSVGFTHLQSHHLYSHIGRGDKYGEPVKLNHKFAIAFTVEMSHESLNYAPQGPVVMESSQQYLNAGTIAIQIATFIRNLGFEARAHIDANYRVICPVVAMDAGLGTIGRMGLLMTPKLGARVRVAVVTTNLELTIPSSQKIDSSVIRFCEICKKCAVNCPSNAISFHSGKTAQGRQPWKINHEKCYTYWCKVGTDCGRCIAVCPYSHPNNFIHNTIRWMIKRNPFNRWLALKSDNYFYSEKPALIPLKKWMGKTDTQTK